jgi:hypothetical protein
VTGTRRRSPRAVVVALVAGAVLASCGEAVSDDYVVGAEPMSLTEVHDRAGVEVLQISLTEQGAMRLGIETVAIARAGHRTVVPLSATFLDAEGRWWVYTSPAPRTYVREPVDVATERGQDVYLSEGPPVGTDVVTVGVPELWGAETGLDH